MTLLESHGLANRPGEPYPATFHMFQWTHWESNPAMSPEIWPACRAGVVPLDHEPLVTYNSHYESASSIYSLGW